MSLRRTLDAMATTVGRASSVPLSASCLVNRAEMLSLIERARAELPAELDEATALLVAHQEVLDQAEAEAEALLDDARERAAVLVDETVIVNSAQARAEAILDAARAEATRLLRGADDYCDRRLASFENDMEKALAQVRRGRDRLRERSDLAEYAGYAGDPGVPEQGTSPERSHAADVYDQGRDEPDHPAQEDRVIDLTAVEGAGLGQGRSLE
jgi:cell division septum initiation protein DivIVA